MLHLRNAYPIILLPAYKDYLWGGQKILTTFKKNTSLKICAESWEASDRSEGLSYIENGHYKGETLKKVLEDNPSFFSEKAFKQLPLLTKLIDANKSLSIQVHPNEEAVKQYGGEAKSEMWHILEAKPKSKIYLGLKYPLSKTEIRNAIESNTLERYMNEQEVNANETYYIPGGLLHSIGTGCLIYEVQQNSNTTYRLYDWGRKDEKGESRELHIDEALNVMLENQLYTFKCESKIIQQDATFHYEELLDSPFCKFNKIIFNSSFLLEPSNVFRIFFVSKGDLMIKQDDLSLTLTKGQSFIVPTGCINLEFLAQSQSVEMLETLPKDTE